jgi:uncharacterized protein YcbK (DUF882 family)
MRLTENFVLSEFKCKDGTAVPDDLIPNVEKLAENLQVLRDYLNSPISINSGYRTEAYNRSVGGASRSQHLQAKAADITAAGHNPADVYEAIEHLISIGKMHNGGLGRYNTFTHYDVRPTRARWDNR